jgi:hypothetical protein
MSPAVYEETVKEQLGMASDDGPAPPTSLILLTLHSAPVTCFVVHWSAWTVPHTHCYCCCGCCRRFVSEPFQEI